LNSKTVVLQAVSDGGFQWPMVVAIFALVDVSRWLHVSVMTV